MSRRIVLEKPLICTTTLANGSRLIGYFMFIHKFYQYGILNAMLHHKNVYFHRFRRISGASDKINMRNIFV